MVEKLKKKFAKISAFFFNFGSLKWLRVGVLFRGGLLTNAVWGNVSRFLLTCRDRLKRSRLGAFASRNVALVWAIIFLIPALAFLFLFINARIDKQSSYAANFTGAVRVSKQSTTLSTAGDWYKSMAYSGDGINGDAEAGNFNPIHPGGTTDGSAGGLAVGYVVAPAATTYATSQFAGFKPDQTGNLVGVQLIIENTVATSLANSDIVVELLQFPSATCTSSCSNYVTGTLGAYDYPNDTIVLRRTVWQHNQGLSGENIQPGNHGRATFDFRFDTPVAVTAGGGAGNHYGIRVTNMGAGAPVFGTWAQAPIADGFPTIDGTIRTIGVQDIVLTNSPTLTMPVVLTGNTILSTNPMVAGNTAAGVGMATVRRTENEHWTATYSSGSGNWTLTGSVSGTQANKLTTATNGGTGASWVNDGVANTTLTADTTTATTRFCVASIAGFAANQYFDVWDSNTASAQFTIASVNASDANCPSSGPSIISTVAMVVNTHNYTVAKNATLARSTWKERIVQGAIAPFLINMPDTTHICVPSGWGSKFSLNTAGTGANIAVWDDDHAIATNTVTLIENNHAACTGGGDRLTVTAITAGTYIITKNAYVAEISATISNTGTPTDGAVAKYTTFNHTQNPTSSALLARTSSVAIAYAKMEAVATSNTRYPFLSNRHLFFVAYGDADTAAPADGDIIMVGNGKTDPDSGDATSLTNDLNWSGKQSHVVKIDRSWDAPRAYTGYNGGAINDGAGARVDFSAWNQYGGWVSAVVSPGSQLGIDNSANKHYRINIPGKIVVDSDASVALGTPDAPLPSSSGHDIHFDTVSPSASTTVTDASVTGNATTVNVTSTTGFAPGDWIVLDDNDSYPTVRVIGAIQSATQITLVVGGAATPVYTSAQASFVAKGATTELPTGSDRRAGVYTMDGVVVATGSNLRTGRVGLYAKGSESFRTEKSDLAVDVEGDINTGYLGNNLTDSGNTWLDVEDNVVGNWQPVDQIAVAGGTNQLADNAFSSMGMAGNDDANAMPLWTGAATKVDTGAGGRTALPTPNMEVAEIGTIPMTNIYNSDYNGGSPAFSSNYNNTSAWTIFGDNANTETNDAVYFGDQGSNMPYALEFNVGTAMVSSAGLSWEYYKSGVGWTAFTPRDAYQYSTRTGVSLPLSVNTVNNSLTITLAEGGVVFGPDQIVMIDDNDSSPMYRRLTAAVATTLTFSEPVTADYTTAQGATVTRLNGGQWQSMNPDSIFTTGTGRRIISWTPDNLNGTPAKTTVNGVNAYWVRARISAFTSWTTSPTNQTTPVGMSGIERIGSGVFNVSSGVQEAKVSEIIPGSSFDPDETYILEYGNSPGWTQIVPIIPAAPYTWHVNNGLLSQNTATADFHISNGDFSWGNYTVTAKVRMRTAADATSRKIGVILRNSLDGNGYAALINKTNAANQIGIYPVTLGFEGTAYSNVTKAFSENSWYWIKANVTGTGASTVLSAKFWADGGGEPGSWDTTYTTTAGQGLWNTGRIGLYADAMIADFDDVSVDNGSVVLSDSFTNTGTWKLRGSVNGDLGTITPGTPFASNYLNFTLKQKGGWNGTVLPEIGDKIYMSPTSTRSYKGISGTGASAITTSDANTVYENVDFEWNPTASNYTVTGSATGAMGTATPGSAYTATGGKIGLTIPSGTPTATKFGNRMLLLQDNVRRNNGSWIGNNGMGSAVLVWPSYTLTSSTIATRYNIEGQSGTATARQRGTIDFWFKTNYTGAPSYTTTPKGMYLLDQANQGNTDRLFVRHTPDGYLEAAIFASTAQNTLLRKSFSPTAGDWHHFRLAWNDSDSGSIVNKKKAWLDGVPFTAGEGQDTAIGNRAANAGIIRIGNTWTYDAPFDGAIDELAIFDDAIDTTSPTCDWGNFSASLPSSVWTSGVAVGCDDADSDQGTNIFRASFDQAMNPQEGSIMADYAFGNPAMIFTNGADTGNERIRVITYPARTRVWVDNTGEKYTPSARIKFGSGYQENATLATLAGWSHNFTYPHKAARQSSASPTYSPVLNLKRSTHIWSVEPITQTGLTMGAPINAGLGFSNGTIGLSGLGTINFSDVSMENQYANFAILTNPYTSLVVKPTQTIANSVFYNYYDRAYTVLGKTQGSNKVGAYFVTTHFGAANIGSGYNAGTSQNVGIDGSIFMGHRNQYVTAPPAAAGGAATFYSGRLYSVLNSEFHNNGITGLGTSGALNLGTGVAKVDIKNNIFSVNTQGLRLYGNAFINMENNIFEGHVSDSITTASNEYGSGIRANPSYSTVGVTDKNSVFGRGLWNEADINLPPNTTTFEAESLLQFIGDGTQLRSPILFGTQDYNNMNRVGDEYLTKTIPGLDIRGTYSVNNKDIVNLTTLGLMRTTGTGLTDTTVRTSGGYGWRMEPTDPDVPLDYTVKLVGVANKPLAATGYIRINGNYGSTNLPTVTLSGLGMTGANLTWTSAATPDSWQQFVVSGTPTESALAELKISGKLDYTTGDSGTSEVVSNATGNYLPALLEDNDKAWTPNQWVGYKLRDANGKVFEIVKNTNKLLYLKGMVVPHLLSTTFVALTAGDYLIYNEPYFYLDDVSVLSGSVDTGTLDFHSQGQPVSPWLATGLTAEGVWNAQWSTFANSDGSFGQLLGDALVAQYADVSGGSPTTTVFNTSLTSTADDFYLNGAIIFTEGQNKGAVRRISDYGGASKTITVDPALPFAPASGDRFALLAATASSGGGGGGGATAAEIWSYTIRTLTDATLNSGSLATAADVANIRSDITSVLTQLGTGTIAAIKTKTDSINWSDITGIVSASGSIQAKTDTIDWANVTGIKTKTDSINWSDVSAIKLSTDTISWSDITTIKGNVATLITQIGTGNIAAIKTKTDSINWADITGIVSASGSIQAKTDTIDWANVTGIKTKTDTIDWANVTGIKTKTDTIAWGDIATLQSSVNALNNISASDVWNYATKTLTGEVTLTADSRKAIWDSACAILNTSGSVGKLVCDNLDAKISSVGSSTLTAEDVWSYTTRTITGLENPALAAIANSVWNNSTKTLTSYGNDITAQDVWNVMTSSLTTIDSIGKLLVTNVDDTISSRASQASVDAMAANMATVLSEIGAGNISAIKTKTDTISWGAVTGLVTTAGDIKLKTDTINWSDIGAIKTATDTISWSDVTAIKLKTNTIEWGDITDIRANVATLITQIGTGNIAAIKTKTDSINWSDITGIVSASGSIQAKTDTIDWANVTGIKTKTDTIDWANVTGIKTKTDTIDWGDIATIKSNADVKTSTRASQASLDAHESADAAFRSSTTTSLSNISSGVSALTLDVGAIASSLSLIDGKIDTIQSLLGSLDTKIDAIDTNVDSIKTTVEATSAVVSAIQTVAGNILNKWGSYSAADIIGYATVINDHIGLPGDASSADTLFGRIKKVQESGEENGGGSSVDSAKIDSLLAESQVIHNKLLDVQLELGFNGKTTSAYDDITALKDSISSFQNSFSTLNNKTSSIASSVSGVSDDLKTVTDRVGGVSVDSFAQLFEVKSADIVYLKNKISELRAVSDINKQLIEKTINQPIVKVLMEWGSVIIKFVIVNPSDSTDQKIPFKAFLPKEVRQEYIMDLGGLDMNYDATTEQYYVTADISLKAGESVTRSVEIKDIWTTSEDEIESIRKQAVDMTDGLKDTSYNAQAVTLKTDIGSRLDRIARKQKDSNATPQDHILAYRENQEDMKAVEENISALKELVMNSGTGKSFLASIGGIQTFATWGILIALIFAMGSLGFFYYVLWRKRLSLGNRREWSSSQEPLPLVSSESEQKASFPESLPESAKTLSTPSPLRLVGFLFSSFFKKVKGVFERNNEEKPRNVFPIAERKGVSWMKKAGIALAIFLVIGVMGIFGYRFAKNRFSHQTNPLSLESASLSVSQNSSPEMHPKEDESSKKISDIVSNMESAAKSESEKTSASSEKIKRDFSNAQKIRIAKTPTGWLNVREAASLDGAVIGKVFTGESYAFSEKTEEWYKIIFSDNKEGWVNGKYVETAELTEKASAGNERKLTINKTPTGWLNVRKDPSLEGDVVGKAYPDEQYLFSESHNGWRKVSLKDGLTGWVSEEYVTVPTAPSSDAGETSSDDNNTGSVLGASTNREMRMLRVQQTFSGAVPVYASPSHRESVVGLVYFGEEYPCLESEGGWCEISYKGGGTGFVFADQFSIANDGESFPMGKPPTSSLGL